MIQPVDLAVGIDVGSVSVKTAILIRSEQTDLIQNLREHCDSSIHAIDKEPFAHQTGNKGEPGQDGCLHLYTAPRYLKNTDAPPCL